MSYPVYAKAHAGHIVRVEFRGQLAAFSSLLPPCGFWKSVSVVRPADQCPYLLGHGGL